VGVEVRGRQLSKPWEQDRILLRKRSEDRDIMGTYGFLMTHPEPSVELDILKVESEVRRWLSSYSKIERYGGRAGKVVRFNEKKYLEDLGAGKMKL